MVLLLAIFLSACSNVNSTNASTSVSENIESKESETPANTNTPTPTPEPIRESIYFGHYEQDGDTSNGAEPIEWEVISAEKGRILLVSKNVLECKPYHTEIIEAVTWETCSLRSWLNEDFFNTAFDASEQEQIITVTNSNPDNAEWGTEGGNDTKDKVFLLSIDEAESLFADDQARTNSTEWWLRSPGDSHYSAAFVFSFGEIFTRGEGTVYDAIGVRPALWISLDS